MYDVVINTSNRSSLIYSFFVATMSESSGSGLGGMEVVDNISEFKHLVGIFYAEANKVVETRRKSLFGFVSDVLAMNIVYVIVVVVVAFTHILMRIADLADEVTNPNRDAISMFKRGCLAMVMLYAMVITAANYFTSQRLKRQRLDNWIAACMHSLREYVDEPNPKQRAMNLSCLASSVSHLSGGDRALFLITKWFPEQLLLDMGGGATDCESVMNVIAARTIEAILKTTGPRPSSAADKKSD